MEQNNLDIIIVNICLSLPLFFLAGYCLIQGWRMYKNGEKIIIHTDRFKLWLVRISIGRKAAEKKRVELLSSEYVKQSGFKLLVSSILIFILAISLVIERLSG